MLIKINYDISLLRNKERESERCVTLKYKAQTNKWEWEYRRRERRIKENRDTNEWYSRSVQMAVVLGTISNLWHSCHP